MRERRDRSERLRVRIPADIDRPDRLIGGLTGHQLALLAGAAATVWLLYAVAHDVLPVPLIGAAAVPVIVAGVGLAIGRRDGLSLDRFLLAAAKHRRSGRLLVPAPSGVSPPPTWIGAPPSPTPAPLELPCRGIDDDGLLDLGDDGAAIVCRARTIGFELRTEDEQAALVAAFGRYLNGLTTPVQVVVRSEPVDVHGSVRELREEAGGLPHQELERAAVAHAQFLRDLATSRTLLKRDVLLVLRDPAGGVDAATRLRVRAEDVVSGLAAAGVTVTVLDQTQAHRCVEAAYDPARVASSAHDREATW